MVASEEHVISPDTVRFPPISAAAVTTKPLPLALLQVKVPEKLPVVALVRAPDVNEAVPSVTVPPEIVPVVVIVLEPLLILPKPSVIEPEFNAPTVVKDDVTTASPKVVAFKTDASPILYASPVTKSKPVVPNLAPTVPEYLISSVSSSASNIIPPVVVSTTKSPVLLCTIYEFALS